MKRTSLYVTAALFITVGAAFSKPDLKRLYHHAKPVADNPIVCPTNVTQSVSGLIGPDGGVLSIAGTVVTIPGGAVLQPETFTLTIPASNYLEIDIHTASSAHYVFESPVTVSISYARCRRNNIMSRPLSAWYWDGGTLLENMGGVDIKATQSVVFSTPHLSGYVIAD